MIATKWRCAVSFESGKVVLGPMGEHCTNIVFFHNFFTIVALFINNFTFQNYFVAFSKVFETFRVSIVVKLQFKVKVLNYFFTSCILHLFLSRANNKTLVLSVRSRYCGADGTTHLYFFGFL
jgi:hypothetical protein